MQKREGRSFVSPPLPYRPNLGRTGRKDAVLPRSPLPPLTTALSRRAALFGAVAVAGVTATAAVTALPATAQAAPIVSVEAATLKEDLVRLSSTYRMACHEADVLNEATPDVDPPEALFAQPGDVQMLWGRFPVESWAFPGRYWFGDDKLIDRLRTDPFRYLDGSPTAGAARRDEIVGAWDRWQEEKKATEDASGYTAAQERFEAAFEAYEALRVQLVEMRTSDPEVLTVKALAIADMIRGRTRGLDGNIKQAMERDGGAQDDALALSLVRDFLGLIGADQRGRA